MVSTAQGSQADRRARTRLAWIVIALLLLAISAFVLLHQRGAAAMPAAAAVEPPIEFAEADVARASMAPVRRRLPLTGTLVPVTQATVKSKVAGEVLETTVREGQGVRRGDLLARIDLRNAGASRDSAQAALEKARADRAIARLNYENSVKLLDQKFVSQNNVDSTRAAYDAALASEKAAEANLKLAANAVEDATVRAPFDGVIARRAVQVGEKVSPDSELYTLVDLTRMELDAPAPTAEVPAIKVGQVASFHVDGFGERQFSGTVWRINPVAEQGSRSIMVYLSVPNEDGALRGGMFAEGALALDAGAPVTAIPLAALREEAGVAYSWVIVDGVLHRRSLRPGLKSVDDGLVEILEGLKPGEQVVVARADALKEGAKVRVPTVASQP